MMNPSPDPISEESPFDKAIRAARLCRMRKDNWGAFAEAQRACELDPRNVMAHDMAAEFARELGQWDDALFHTEQAQYLDPDNAARNARLEKLRKDAKVYSRSMDEVLTDAHEGADSWLTVARYVFMRPDPIWYRAGWFHSLMGLAGIVFLFFGIKWFLASGPWFFLLLFLHLAATAWVTYDARSHGEPIVFWGPVAFFAPFFGFVLYLAVQGMGSGIGAQGGGRFFSG